MDAYPMIEQCWERQQEGYLPTSPTADAEDLRWYYADTERARGLPPPPVTGTVPTEWRAPDIPMTPALSRGDMTSFG